MVICPNCGKKLRDNFIYCRICGSKLNGEKIGDFSTEVVNVFNYGDEFLYLYSANGRQIILKSSSLEELESEVVKNSHPWSFKDSSKNVEVKKSETVPAPEFTTEFLKASSLKKPEIISTSSTFKKSDNKKEEGYNPDFEVSHVVEKPKPKIIPVTEKPEKSFTIPKSNIDFGSVKPKRNPNRCSEDVSYEEIPREYGILGVYKEDGKWAFKTNENKYALKEDSLEKLERIVCERGFDWLVVDDKKAKSSYKKDEERIKRNDEKILEKRRENEKFWQEKSKLTKEMNQKRMAAISDKMANRNKDFLLR